MNKIIKKISRTLTITGISIFTIGTQINTQAKESFKNKLYCNMTDTQLIVSLTGQENTKCQNYILFLQGHIYKEYQKIQQINKLINQGSNTLFRREIKEKKLTHIRRINAFINSIKNNINQFEQKILKQTKKDISNELKKEEDYLKKIKNNLLYVNIKSQNINLLKESVNSGIQILKEILITDNMDSLIGNVTKYFYLKKAVLGILES